MTNTHQLAEVAALVGDNARAAVLTALMADRALTATELAQVADVTKQTISGHLAKLIAANLLTVETQGRHRYFRLADEHVARLIESLMGVAFRNGARQLSVGPAQSALRKARTCYDHLAGELAVQIYAALSQSRALRVGVAAIEPTRQGRALFAEFGIDPAPAADDRRVPCRSCLDWSERRFHLAGRLGAQMLTRFFELGWARRQKNSRVVLFTAQGERELLDFFVHRVAR